MPRDDATYKKSQSNIYRSLHGDDRNGFRSLGVRSCISQAATPDDEPLNLYGISVFRKGIKLSMRHSQSVPESGRTRLANVCTLKLRIC